MALFKINKGLNANLPEPRHDGYAYFTTDDGKFWIDFEDNVNGVTQQDGTKVDRKALNAERADYVGYKLTLLLDGETPNWGDGANTYNGLVARSWNITPESINAFDIIDGSVVSGEAIFNNVVYLNDDTYADHLTAENAIITGALRVVGDLNGSTINASSFVGNLTGTASNAAKTTGALTLKINNTVLSPTFNGNADTTITISTSDILDGILYAGSSTQGGPATSANKLIDAVDAGDSTHPVYFDNGIPVQVSGTQAINVASADKVNNTLTLLLDGNNFTNNIYDGSNECNWNITPESINAVRRDGDTIPGPLTINGVLTINNDAYIDSATIGDLLVNGGTRFVGDVNAGQITASNFIGDLTGNASTATAATKANRVTMAGSVVFYEDNVGTFGNTYELLWDNTNGILTAPEVKSYITVGQRTNTTLGEGATIEGYDNIGSGQYSHVEGTENRATQRAAHAEGFSNKASGYNSHAEGFGTTADGNNAHAEGQATKASGYCSHAEGLQTTARRAAQHVFGTHNIADVAGDSSTKGTYVEIVGNGAPSAYSNARTLDWSGNEWLAGSLTATSLIGSLNNSITLLLDGETPEVQTFGSNIFNNNASLTWNITPQSINAFDILDGSTVSGEAIFNNAVYLNDETYADSLTVGNEIITGALRVVGDINGSTINATTFVGNLTGTASNAAKTTGALTLKAGTQVLSPTFDGHQNETITITLSDLGGLSDTTTYAASPSIGGSASTALALVATNGDANSAYSVGGSAQPVYFANGIPVAITGTINNNAATADKVNNSLTLLFDGDNFANNIYDGSDECNWDITPENINAIRRDGDTIPGYLTLNNVLTVNNDAYIDSATIGDLLVNGGTRFVGAVNAETMTASQFIGPLQGTASNAAQTTGSLYLDLNGQVQSTLTFNGSADKTWRINPSTVGAVDLDGDTMTGSLTFSNADIGIRRPGRAGSWWEGRDKALIASTSMTGYNAIISTKTTSGSWEMGAYNYDTSWDDKLVFSYVPDTSYNGQTNDGTIQEILFYPNGQIEANGFIGNASSANKVNNKLTLLLDGETPDWGSGVNTFDGEYERSWNITPQSINAFDVIDGSVVSGEAIFNNVVYLNDDTYADSLTAENAIITGALRVVGDINGSTINATTFVGNLTGTASNAAKTTGALTLKINNTVLSPTFNGNADTTITISTSDILDGILYAGSSTQGGAATSAEKLVNSTDAGDSTHPVYFANGIPVQVSGTQAINVASADKVNETLTILLDGELPSTWASGSNVFDGSAERNWNITPEAISAIRRDGDTIPGPLTLNGVFTVNNDAYIDSATIGDLLVNGGTRFVGAINAGNITATQFTGPLQGTASNAAQTTGTLTLTLNSQHFTNNTFNGSVDRTWNITASSIGALPDSTLYAGSTTVGGSANHALKLVQTNNGSDYNVGSTTQAVYFENGIPKAASGVLSNTVAKANETAGTLTLLFDGDSFENNTFNGSTDRNWSITPQLIHAFDVLDGDTVYGEATFNNAVYLNDETYADSLTVGNEIITGALRVVGDINGSTINATTFNGYLNGTAKEAEKTTGTLTLTIDGSTVLSPTFNGSQNTTIDISSADILASLQYAGSSSAGGSAYHALKLVSSNNGSDIEVGSSTQPVYFDDGVPVACTGVIANASTAESLTILLDGELPQTWATGSNVFNGATQRSWNITPEIINAVRRDGDTIPGPLTLNGVFTVNNDAYIDSATIGDLLVNGGTRFIGTVNAGTITATSFVGDLTGTASNASQTTGSLYLTLNGQTESAVTFNGSADKTWIISPATVGAVDLDGDTMTGALTIKNITIGGGTGSVAGRLIESNDTLYINRKANTSLIFEQGGTEHARFDTTNNFVPKSGATATIGTESLPWPAVYATTFNGNATSATQVGHDLTITLDGELPSSWAAGSNVFNGANDRSWDINPQNIHAFDVLDGDTVYGEATFNNVVYLNDETYADSLTAENALVTGALRVVGPLNSSVINATTVNGSFVGSLTGTASNAAKTTGTLTITLDGETPDNTIWTDGNTFNGSADRSWDLNPQNLHAFDVLDGDTVYGPAIFNNTLTVNNDAYIDSATIGDLLVNGGTRFVGDVNAGTINANSFVGDLTGTASNAAQTTGNLYLKLNNEYQATLTFNGSTDKTWDIQPSTVGAAPAVNGVYYGTCDTAQTTKAKEVILVNGTGFELVTGAMIAVKFTNASAAATMTLKVGTDAASAAAAVGKNLYRYGTTAMSSGAGTTGWRDGAVVLFVYDATADSNNGGWFRTHWENNTYTLPTVTNIDCETDADAAAKEITNGAWLDERDGNIQEVTMRYANTYAGSLTFNSRPLYINGHPSSATNYTLPAGKYMVYYNGDYYCFNTNGHYAGKDFIHSINVGSSSIGTAGVYTYYKFASFAITGANEVASTIVRYRATYKVNSVYPAYNQNNGYTFTVDFTLNTDASNNILITSINCSYNGAMPYSNYCYYAVASDNKTLELYWASYATYHYLANIELLTVDKILLAGDTIPECVAYISGTGYELTFLYLNDVTTNSVTVGTPNMINNYAYSRYAVNSYYLYQYAAPANNTTTKYFLCGGGQSATSTTYSTINSQANYSPDVYLLNRELYAPLHVNKLYGTSDVTYGGTLPSSPTTGQIFFQTGGSSTSGGLGLPTGGATGQQLYKNSSADGDCVWSNPNVANTTATTVYVTGCTSTTSKQQYHSNIYMNCSTGVLMGAAWNDYAEYRESDVIEPGRCIIENGDDTLSLSNERMLPGAEIVSDTFGFAIGKTGKCQTPVAASGRVLAYPYEDRNEFKPGMPVCSGPNGTVSIMTKEEARENPWCIIGTVSAVPNYDTWGEANVKVNGRIWIRIR